MYINYLKLESNQLGSFFISPVFILLLLLNNVIATFESTTQEQEQHLSKISLVW